MVTMSASLSFNIFSYDVKCGTFHSAPALAARSGSVSQTATRLSPSIWSMASKWFLLMRPAPERAIRKFFSALTSGLSPKLVTLLSVPGAASCALLWTLVGQPLAALAHPADAARRHSHHQRVGGHIPGDHAPGADERVLVERDTADHGRIRADGRALSHQRALVFVLARHVTARIDHVGEHHRRPTKHVVFEHHTLVHRDVVLNLDVVAYADAVHPYHVLSERAPLADDRAAEHVTKMPDLGVGADPRAVVDVRRLMDERLGHQTPAGLGIRVCHSCSDSTDGGRERSARIASQAALAADNVVVYATWFAIAAWRIV